MKCDLCFFVLVQCVVVVNRRDDSDQGLAAAELLLATAAAQSAAVCFAKSAKRIVLKSGVIVSCVRTRLCKSIRFELLSLK